MKVLLAAGLLLAAPVTGIAAPCPPEPGLTLPQSLFPQPVTAGWLAGRLVLAPKESQPVLARLRNLQRGADGDVQAVLLTGGFLAHFDPPWDWGARPVAVPLRDLALLGDELVLIGPANSTATPSIISADPLPPDTEVCLGLTKPSH